MYSGIKIEVASAETAALRDRIGTLESEKSELIEKNNDLQGQLSVKNDECNDLSIYGQLRESEYKGVVRNLKAQLTTAVSIVRMHVPNYEVADVEDLSPFKRPRSSFGGDI